MTTLSQDQSIFSLGATLIKTTLIRGITVTDNTLGSIEDASSILNRTTGVADTSNKIWATKTIATQEAELEALMAELKA